jgi:hypothetical protein
MKNSEFIIWLQGYLELCDDSINKKKLRIMKNHLNLVKAVEGQLNDLNQIFYEKISNYIQGREEDINNNIKNEFYLMLIPLFKKNFPNGYFEKEKV